MKSIIGLRGGYNFFKYLQFQSRSISSRRVREAFPQLKKPPPFPYEAKKLRWYHFDETTSRLDDNSRIILVEGPLACGKTSVAKAIAEEFDFLYIPEANLNMFYVDSYGFDKRRLNKHLPPGAQFLDVCDFLKNPRDKRNAIIQYDMLNLRFSLYCDAIAHLLSTGQGVVMDRSLYSDIVFTDSLFRFGYLSANFRRLYGTVHEVLLGQILKPHVIVYLDVPHKLVYQKIKERSRPFEVNSEVLSEPFLEYFEAIYKQRISLLDDYCEILTYDWSKGGDPNVIIEDIEELQIVYPERDSNKFIDWRITSREYEMLRRLYADNLCTLLAHLNVVDFEVPELFTSGDDQIELENVLENMYPNRYIEGFNIAQGDKVLFKTEKYNRGTIARIEHNYDDPTKYQSSGTY